MISPAPLKEQAGRDQLQRVPVQRVEQEEQQVGVFLIERDSSSKSSISRKQLIGRKLNRGF